MFIFWLIVFIVGLVIALPAFLLMRKRRKADDDDMPPGVTALIAGVVALIGLIFLVLNSFYTQGPGEAVLQKDITGNVVGSTTSTGLHAKAPWIDTTQYNIRQQQIKFVSDGKTDNSGGEADGSQVTVQDKDGVTSNIDVSLRYSIRPDSVEDIYKQFGSEDNFKQTFIEQDIRSAVRDAPNQFHTLELLTNRIDVTNAIQKDLEARWKEFGVTIDSVSLQEVRAPKSVTESYAQAQQAQINVTKEQSKLDAAKVSAQQKVVQAQAEADANAKLAASLTPQILQQRYLDTLKELAASGNLVVVPEGFNGLVNVSK